jgi:hypothetical protein
MASTRTVPRRSATLQTWQPVGQIASTLTTRRIPFTGDPAAFIQRAAGLVPGKRPWRLRLTFFDTIRNLTLDDETDRPGVQTFVQVSLQPADIPILLAYVLQSRGTQAGILFVDLDDGRDGDDVSVPRVTVDALAQMPTAALVL